MLIVRNIDGRVVQRSQNLRGIIDRNLKITVERADLFGPNKNGGGTLGVTWSDGSTCLADFESFAVMQKWVAARRAFSGTVKQAELVQS